MALLTTQTLQCDRCRAELQIEPGDIAPGWGGIMAARSDGNDRRVGHGQPDDLCPRCITELFDWSFARPAPAEQPLPPPSPPPPARRASRVTLEHRQQAKALAIEVIGQQLGHAIALIRGEPTVILGDQPIVGVSDGLDERATAIAAAIAEIYGFSR